MIETTATETTATCETCGVLITSTPPLSGDVRVWYAADVDGATEASVCSTEDGWHEPRTVSEHRETVLWGLDESYPVRVDTVVTDSDLPGRDPENVGHDALVTDAVRAAHLSGWALIATGDDNGPEHAGGEYVNVSTCCAGWRECQQGCHTEQD